MSRYTVTERTSGIYTFFMKRPDGSALPVSALETARLAILIGELDGPALLSDRSCLNTNNVTIDGNGLVTWSFPPNHMRINGTANPERHLVRFRFTWDSGDQGLEHVVRFDVHAS